MANKCHVTGCNRSVARKGYMWALMVRAGLTRSDHSMLASAFGEGACAFHCADQVKRVAFQEGLEVREVKDKIKVIGHKQPVKHYPSSSAARARRLAELEEEMRRPDQVSMALDKLEAKVQALKLRQTEAEKERAAKAQAARLYQYLRVQGYDDPSKLFNV